MLHSKNVLKITIFHYSIKLYWSNLCACQSSSRHIQKEFCTESKPFLPSVFICISFNLVWLQVSLLKCSCFIEPDYWPPRRAELCSHPACTLSLQETATQLHGFIFIFSVLGWFSYPFVQPINNICFAEK